MSCGVVAELLWGCRGVVESWSCHEVVVELSWSCHEVVVELSWGCRGVVVRLSWSCRGVVVRLSWSCRGVVVRLSWSCREVIVELSWGYRGVVVRLSWGCRGVVVEWTPRKNSRGGVDGRLGSHGGRAVGGDQKNGLPRCGAAPGRDTGPDHTRRQAIVEF